MPTTPWKRSSAHLVEPFSAALPSHPDAGGADLGFRYRIRKDGDVVIFHGGRLASTLRGHCAVDFQVKVRSGTESDAQHLMARVTGNYPRGNERAAARRSRNRR